MKTILDKILAVKKEEVVRLKTIPIQPKKESKKRRSFQSILKESRSMVIIAEFKRASPSKGNINVDVDPIEQVKTYRNAGANAISVLTDNPFFKGSFHDLEIVRKEIDLPILCKDFIIDPIQIDFAADKGADIILLIAAALNNEELKYLYEYAKDKELEVLMEVHNEEELERVLATENLLIGVNNRNLKTFEVDLRTTELLAPTIKQEGRFLISESGMKTIDDVATVRDAGANGILVGETFMKHGNVTEIIKEMKLPLAIH